MMNKTKKKNVKLHKTYRNETILTIFWFVILIALWEIIPRVGLANEYLLPTFSSTVKTMILQISDGSLGLQVLSSLKLVFVACFISMAISILATFLCIYSKVFESLFRTLCIIFNPLPGLAILPLIMMWFGIGNGAMILLIVHGIVWPLVDELLSGYKSMCPIYRDFSKNIGLNAVKETFSVLIFAIMPNFLSGMRIGWGRAWRALIGAEMVFGMMGDYGGLGYYISIQRAYANIPRMMAGVLIIIILGVLIDQFVFRMIERLTIEKWGMANAK